MAKSWYRLAEILLPNELNAAIESNKKISKPQTVDVTASNIKKENTKKYASIGTSQMRSGRSSTIQTSSVGLLSQATIKKNTLLGG